MTFHFGWARPASITITLLGSAFALSYASGPSGDGVHLRVDKGAAPATAVLSWDTGPYLFSVYRSSSAATVLDPANKLGETSAHTWSDTPPSGQIFFYEITSSCAYNPPEVCNGVDDDCDGVVDGPGTEASCHLPHATAACAGGCVVAACDTGYGDCDGLPADGCETDTHVAQSTSPSSIWQDSPNPNQDLKPGYTRVAAIANCGGCGVTCDDGIPCTTDLCVPVGGSGTCRHYDRGQCSEARCGGLNLPPGTPPPGDPACTFADNDNDGLPDSWEVAHQDPYTGSSSLVGIDLNCDGEISTAGGDMIYDDPPSPTVPDVYVQYDYMAASATETESHAPPPEAVAAVVAAFASRGIVLHVDPVHHEVPHAATIYFPAGGTDSCAVGDSVSFYGVKGANFDPKHRFTHHYLVFGHKSCYAGASESNTSGLAEFGGDDAMVTLGGFDYTGTAPQVHEKAVRETAGTMMHEIGHTMGLDHGGPHGPCTPPCPGDAVTRKANFLSVMNYRYQLTGIYRSQTPGSVNAPDPTVPWRVDFSHESLGTLDETNLDETAGIVGAPAPRDRDVVLYDCFGAGPHLGPASGAVDWNCDATISPGVMDDLNSDGTFTTLRGADDWTFVNGAFQCTPAFAPGTPDPSYVTGAELTADEANARHLRAFLRCQTASECDDGVFCNGTETCSPEGVCNPGTPPTCDDGNPCTVDTCNAATDACAHTAAANGTACSTGQFCIVAQTCTNGMCGGGAPRNCDDGLACTADSCSETLQACRYTCTTAPCWTVPLPGGPVSAAASDASFFPPARASYSYVTQGSKLYSIRNTTDATGAAGSIAWTWSEPTGSTIQNFPSPVPLSNGGEYIYLGAQDGFLYKIRTDDGATTVSVDTRRATCAADQLVATPSVQLYQFSNPTWRNEMDSHPGHVGDDAVFVVTRTGCGDTTNNRIFAFYASDLTAKWTFNASGNRMVDFGSDGCAIDYTNDRIYCGTNQPSGYAQNTLWAINSMSGSIVWSTNAGPIWNRPQLANGRLYVGNLSYDIQAYDPNGDGSGNAVRLWTAPISVSGTITRNIWPEFRAGGYAGTILAIDSTGTVSSFTDQGSRASFNWSVTAPPGITFTSMGAVSPDRGTAYIGRNDGKLQQVSLATGALGATLPVSPPGSVGDPWLDDLSGVSRVYAGGAGAATGAFSQFCGTPISGAPCTASADCIGLNTSCTTGVCDVPRGVCFAQPLSDGSFCDDGKPCSTGDACQAGRCKATSYAGCPCTQIGDAACGGSQTCCGTTCVDLNVDSGHCGGCSVGCATDQTCVQGACLVAPAPCASPSVATLTGAASLLSGADAIAFDRAVPSCSAYTSTFRYPSTSAVLRVDPAGAVATLPSPDPAPLHGIAVALAGNQVYATMVNRTSGSVPQTNAGLLEGQFSPAHASVASVASATFASQPFSSSIYDTGPVGPAFDAVGYQQTLTGKTYFGNWNATGDLYVVQQACPGCSWSANPVPVTIVPAGSRITAIALAPARTTPPIQHRQLYIAHGSVLTVYDLDLSTQIDVNLTISPGVQSILSVAVQPVYGDVIVEVRDQVNARKLLLVRQDDHSVRNLNQVEADLKTSPIVPPTIPVGEGRIVIQPSGKLLRIVPSSTPSGNPQFSEYGAER